MIELSFEDKQPELVEPRFLIIYSKPKVGKTQLLMSLPNSLHIDLEDSGGFYKGNSMNINKLASKNNVSPIKILGELRKAIVAKNEELKKPAYDYIILDSATVLEEYANILALSNYKKSVIGKNFTGTDVVKELPQGAGYSWAREAFEQLYEPFMKLAGKCFILVVHTKDTMINKEGKDVVTAELNLLGKSKLITSSRADGIGLLYRSKDKKDTNILSFKSNDSDTSVGCRLPYLRNQDFEISKLENGEFVSNWELVFPSLKK